ncbi:sulfite exporter TauE/SafE family protein [Chitinophaga solisilvae]|uniref:Probable membrane transporter protein n=1 Tax=Chitinophaga solisilvae TaxID=1233460 RepID=A0A433WA45_9BACT|nr:sulfite exporter TauE/SafE family protein [Chitinophaga solisilvae]NSL88706.1 sulfite exporter TauE/SafE family protein [Chitinophaga solisilvae]
MTIIVFTLILLCGAFLAGLLGSLTGLGGGVVIIPLLTLIFHVDIRYAIGTALIASIATSSGSAAAYVKEGITNIRLGMFLEIATTTGAVVGALLAVYMPTNVVAIIFGCVLIFSAVMSLRKKMEMATDEDVSKLARQLKLNGSYPTPAGPVAYKVRHVPGGYFMMMFAGVMSGLLGIGSGALKVLAMDNIMRIPFKVSTTTSNFMIGVTAAASAVVYLQRGYISPGLCMPVVLGVLAGAFGGSKLLVKANTKWLRIVFSVVITFLALQMIYNGSMGKL